jgi:hypothetical protein
MAGPTISEAWKAVEADAEQLLPKEKRDNPHLRSTREVIGYHIQSTGGEIGHVEDVVVDDKSWAIRYIVANTQNWLPGGMVLVAPQWIERINWAERKVFTYLLRETIKDAPEFDPSTLVDGDYEAWLYEFYGRPKHWIRL